jgi:6,7-dimethyl-8-ribityllumazine synthase
MRIGIVASSFNAEIVDGLLAGTLAVLSDCGVEKDAITVVRVPGALELPVAARALVDAQTPDGIIALGCVIRGETAHFEHVSRVATDGMARLADDLHVAVGTGILTVDTLEQARTRAGLEPDPGGSKEGNRHRGREAALACLVMAGLLRQMGRESG